MSLTESQVREALETCAAEPVHIPGIVQPFACLIAADIQSQTIAYASENSPDFLGVAPETLFGKTLTQVLGPDVTHQLANMLATGTSDKTAEMLGDFIVNDSLQTLHAFTSDNHIIVEIEPAQPDSFTAAEQLKALSVLMAQVESCETEQSLFDITTRALRRITGFDRVKVYRFDHEFNGEVVAEDRRNSMPSFLGLCFPHWDIPAQAREIMRQLPVRFITDARQTPVPLLARDKTLLPLNITLAGTRGVSAVHMEYLNNMGIQSTMTLSIMVEGKLWGIISFHHIKPRVPSPNIRAFLAGFQRIFTTKLNLLRQKSRLDYVARVDALNAQVMEDIDEQDVFESFAKTVLQVIEADGLFLATGNSHQTYGTVPSEPLLSDIRNHALNNTDLKVIENLSETFPNQKAAANGCAGVIIVPDQEARRLLFFRQERLRDVTWAGNPEKTIEPHEGKHRLSPRGSFSTYMQQVSGHCAPWSEQDQYFAERIWSFFDSFRRNEMVKSLSRQQQIMIDELNHRVRNILTLVRSISQQARRTYGSLESYSKTLEARISALAASHDLASGSLLKAVPIQDLILKEFEPYQSEDEQRLHLFGQGAAVLAEIAPIFSLVIHELVTNAVKYGALSQSGGRVSIRLSQTDEGLQLDWQETGGPAVSEPSEFGFGTTLIRQAIPHELNGAVSLRFKADGVVVRMTLPQDVLETDLQNIAALPEGAMPLPEMRPDTIDLSQVSCLVLEDNFVIGEGMRQQLLDFGLGAVEVVSNLEAARAYLASEQPSFCILDVNLGRGATSMDLAHELRNSGMPFFFVSGYGDTGQLDEGLKGILSLTKPATSEEFLAAIKSTLATIA